MMLDYEKAALEAGYTCIAGVDEVGRGPLAGPVVTACVVLPLEEALLIDGITDSKKLSPKKRAVLEEKIVERGRWALGIVDEKRIDEINILNATKEAMVQSVLGLDPLPDMVLVDAVKNLALPMAQQAIIKGDLNSYLIGAASIVAKEARDRMMKEYDKLYPGYGFARNMGYGTAEHIAALKAMGPCPIHRAGFLTKILGGNP